MNNNAKKKRFPKKTVDTLILYLLEKGTSFREIQEIFKDVRNYTYPSLGYISKFAKKQKIKFNK